MAIFSSTLTSFTSISFLSPSQSQFDTFSSSFVNSSFSFSKCPNKVTTPWQWHHVRHSLTPKIFVSESDIDNSQINQNLDSALIRRPSAPDLEDDDLRIARRSSDWEAANAYKDSGLIYHGRAERINNGGLLIRFYSLLGFLPFPELSPVHSCKEPEKPIEEIANGLLGSMIPVKVLIADEEKNNLLVSEKEVTWSKYSKEINIGNVFHARVGAVEDYGAFVYLRFPDGLYHLLGLLHVSEVSWDVFQDIRDFLTVGDEIRVKIIKIDGQKIRLSMRQLEIDPLLQTLDKVIPQDAAADPDSLSGSNSSGIEPLPGLETILEELLQEDGIFEAKISHQVFEKRVVSDDFQLWLSNAPPVNQMFTLLARAGSQVQEIHLNTSLDQEGIKKAIQRVLERVP